ncbi:hypothetical protein [Exiguobacterium sp. s189]|uniref:capsular polysaccharide export protein, LipB/KpsS family n=1 Tax=Exiguobacterium sp. s189 TaxID=2751263 RepID=UPI001BE85901|nr:hypothetical protein [Exiguobacterium sp. s189]
MKRFYKIAFSGFSGMDYRNEEINDVYLLKSLIQKINKNTDNEVCYLFNPIGDGINLKKYFYLLDTNVKRYNLHSIRESTLGAFEKLDEKQRESVEKIIHQTYEFNLKMLGRSDITQIRLRVYKLINRIDWLIDNEKINLFIVFGDSLESSVIRLIANQKNVRCVSLENGYFRPFTLMVDHTGVNAESSIPKQKKFYENLEFKDLETLYDNRRTVPQIQNQVINRVKEYRNWYYKELGIILTGQPKEKDSVSVKTISEKLIMKNERYIFVPLQLETDMQIIKNAPQINSLYDFLSKVVNLVTEINNSLVRKNEIPLKIIFKKHPLYIAEAHLESYKKIESLKKDCEILFESNKNTSDLLEKTECVFTINSTVGFEAIERFKKVVTFGNAFYNIEGLTLNYEENTDAKIIEDYLNFDVNTDLVKKFVCYLRYDYFCVINRRYPSEVEIENLIDRILGVKNEK